MKVVPYNPTVEQMYTPQLGPANPFKTQQAAALKNMFCGYVEDAGVRLTISPVYHLFMTCLSPVITCVSRVYHPLSRVTMVTPGIRVPVRRPETDLHEPRLRGGPHRLCRLAGEDVRG